MTSLVNLTVITDCFDVDASLRQKHRYLALMPVGTNIEIKGICHSIETSFCALGVLDASRVAKNGVTIIVGNCAPRTDKTHKNGAPFSFAIGDSGRTIIIGTADTFVLPLKMGIISKVYQTDTEKMCEYLSCHGFLAGEDPKRIAASQFRSFEYLPYLAQYLFEERDNTEILEALVAQQVVTIVTINPNEFDGQIGYIDYPFGNVKIICNPKHIDELKTVGSLHFKGVEYLFYDTMSQMSKDSFGVTVGSSGYGSHRFIEIVINGGNAGTYYNLALGQQILPKVIEQV